MTRFWDGLRQDLRYACRMMRIKPGFTAVAVLSIALGIGATTTIFSVVYAVLIDPYPYRAADRIGWIGAQTGAGRTWNPLFTEAQYLELLERAHSIEGAVAVQLRQPILTGSGLLPEIVSHERTSPNFFEFYGVPPLVGRAFTSRDFPPGTEPERVAVISYKFWQREFQGSPDAIGRKVVLDHMEYTITGVLPPRFTWNDAELYTPIAMRPGSPEFVQIYARVRPGVIAEQVQAEVQPLIRVFQKQVPAWYYPPERFRVKWVGVNDGILGRFATTLIVLFASVVLLLLIGCGNVANLLLARATTREGEMAVRISIGATRRRLIRQLLTESVLLAICGGVLGVLLAIAGVRAVIALMPEYSIPHEAVISVNWPVLWFALAVSILTGILFGIVPALQVSGKTQAEALKGSGRGAGGSVKHRRLLDLLVVCEVALSLLLLTGAGLALKGLMALQRTPLGYDPEHVLTFEVPLGEGNYLRYGARRNFFDSIVSRLRSLPGVESAAISEQGTPPWNGAQTRFILDNRPVTEPVQGAFNIVGDEYFSTVRQALLRGRALTHDDMLRVSPVAVITEEFATRYYPNMSPLGRHIQVDLLNQPLPAVILKPPNFSNSFEIVGVVGTARNRGLSDPSLPAAFVPYTFVCSPGIFMLARTRSDPMALTNDVRKVIRDLDPHQAITQVHPLAYWLQFATAYPRFAAFLFGVFGVVALLLAGAGVFSVVSYGVAQRTREFGIRMAMGATTRDVLHLVLTGSGRVFSIGLVAGLALSILAARQLPGRMEGMGTPSLSLFVLAPLVLMTATLAACLLPARAAALVQPMDALRHE
ncbi:MAG: ABC transporter permease [Acidobacteriaceae bacterium]|nr:ABC transporter permease [Acidobacteriaceae bacterium]MBV8570122.1 ABC transporter permease [Acidobacteriaceae bacterium]